jgi:hypothetical protein
LKRREARRGEGKRKTCLKGESEGKKEKCPRELNLCGQG